MFTNNIYYMKSVKIKETYIKSNSTKLCPNSLS